MHPVLSSVRGLFWYLLSWLLGGAVSAGMLSLSGLAPGRNALWFALPVCVGYAFVIPSAYYLCRAMPFTRRRLVPTLGLFAGSSALAGGFAWGLGQAWNRLSLALEQDWAGLVLTPTANWALFGAGGLGYLLSLLAHDLVLALGQMREAQRRELLSRALAQAAELQLLRAQINPHFLFNCLNSISALTSIDAAAARAMTIALAQYFRQTLSMTEQTSISLEQEIAHCRCFLDIETQRFGAKLVVEIDLPDDAQAALVPPMILQPLVENAVKHGVAQSAIGGTVRISALVRDGWLHLSVENPVEPQPAENQAAPSGASGIGLGLKNTQQRLSCIHGERARLVRRATPNSFVVELTLPFTSAANGAPTP